MHEMYSVERRLIYARDVRVTYGRLFVALIPHAPCAACGRAAPAHATTGKCLFGPTHYRATTESSDNPQVHDLIAPRVTLHARRANADTVILGLWEGERRTLLKGDTYALAI